MKVILSDGRQLGLLDTDSLEMKNMTNYYSNSWELYKLHSASFNEDFKYYLEFSKGYKTLELFAGYGRLTNFLFDHGIDIESVELEPNFAKFITIPENINHVCNVLNFNPKQKFQRIIAAYNSFCLLTNDSDISLFFHKLDSWLTKDGLVSLSYYHPDAWEALNGVSTKLDSFNNVTHFSKCDLSKRKEKIGIWIDEYHYDSKQDIYSYPVRIYETRDCLKPFLKGTDLVLKNIIQNYDCPDISDPGWIEFVLEKK